MENKFSLTISSCDNETFRKLGDKIKALRTNRGVSQQELSKITNRDRSGLSGYERGVKTPTLHGLYDISNALNYNFKIQFEEREGASNMYRNEVFTKEFVQEFIESFDDLSIEYNKLISMCEKELEIVELSTERVILKTTQDDVVVLTKKEVDFELSSKRYCPVEVKCEMNDDCCLVENILVDLQGVYSLVECAELRNEIVGCIALDGILESVTELDGLFENMEEQEHNMLVDSGVSNYKEFLDVNTVMQMHLCSYMYLKREICLTDNIIMDIIKMLNIQTEGALFLDTLTSDKAQSLSKEEKLEFAYCYAYGKCLEEGDVDEHILNVIRRLASVFKLEHYVSMFLFGATNLELEENINLKDSSITCMDMIFEEIDSLTAYIYKYLKCMPKEQDYVYTIMSLVSAFFREIHVDFAIEVIDAIMDKVNGIA